ncbi:uncharacterized protein LOC108629396 [Ceratina calcarata]|uniref:Uncharacterized protein LOC108629396 n=1 Tax=Ceratina calcarata TaxID=156304 RepID=A0AAJ7S850_9HYME|nr:uncharacterized protein LOC108629396 [Ceratina calcarata]
MIVSRSFRWKSSGRELNKRRLIARDPPRSIAPSNQCRNRVNAVELDLAVYVTVCVPVDPLAPIRELDPCSLERSLAKEKELYVACPTKDDGLVFRTLCLLPKPDRDYQQARKRSLFSIFPRSPQHELWYIRDRRWKNFLKRSGPIVDCTKKEEVQKVDDDDDDDEPCGFLKARHKFEKPKSLPLGNINDYTVEKLQESSQHDAKLSEKLNMDHPKKYIPGVIHRMENPDDTSMQDALERADAFRVVLKMHETPSASPPVDERVSSKEHPRVSACCCETDDDVQVKAPKYFGDERWQPLHEDIPFPKENHKRHEELRKLTYPFLHELHTWYSKNKPTRLIVPLRSPGKRPMPEMRFSHL